MKSDVEREFPEAYRLLFDFCVSHGIGYHDPSRDDVLPLHEALDAAWRRGMEEAAGVLKETDESVRLHAGELSAREMRAVQAVLKWKATALRALAAKGAHA